MSEPWDRRSPENQARLQGLVLDDWVNVAASFSAFWGDRFSRVGVDPARITSPDLLTQMPPVRERDLLSAGGPGSPELVLRPTEAQVKARGDLSTLWRIARAIRGGGGAGKRRALLTEYKPVHLQRGGRDGDLIVAYTRSDLDRLHRTGARAAAVLGLSDADYLVSAVPRDDTLAFWGVYHLALGTSMLAVHPRGTDEPLDSVLGGFGLVPATVVAAPVADALELAALATEHDLDVSRVSVVVAAGPPPEGGARRRIRDAWRAAGARDDLEVLALWAPPAARALWAECAPGSGLHTYPDMEVVEVVDPATGRVSGGQGDLTYTSAGWNGTAVIRYQTGDHVAGLATEPCSRCGRTVPRIASPVTPAIWQPSLRVGTRDARVDLRGAGIVLGAAGLEPWRLELRRKSPRSKSEGYVVRLGGDPDDREDLERDLRAAIGEPPMEILVEDAEAIERDIAETGAFADLR